MPTHLITSAPLPCACFRERLQAELAARCERNPRYSLRAFANFLTVDHATLSQLLRGKRAMTPAAVRRFGSRIGLAQDEIAAYLAMGDAPSAPAVRALAEDAAQVLGQWQAFAILELMRLASFRPDVRWIARVLGVTGDEVNIALQHLIRLGFLQMESATSWRDLTGGAIQREEEFTLLAFERLAERSRALQQASLRNAPGARRLHGAATIALSAQDLPRLMALVEKFIADVGASATRTGADQLYHVDVHCLPLSAPDSPTPKKE